MRQVSTDDDLPVVPRDLGEETLVVRRGRDLRHELGQRLQVGTDGRSVGIAALLMNWFLAKGTISSGIVEGMNNKAKLVMRRAYGFRTYQGAEVALYHNLGDLPEPHFTHRFC